MTTENRSSTTSEWFHSHQAQYERASTITEGSEKGSEEPAAQAHEPVRYWITLDASEPDYSHGHFSAHTLSTLLLRERIRKALAR